MSSFSIAQARNHFSSLVDRAEAGEDVVITRHGQVVAELKAAAAGRRRTPVDVEWLRARRAPRAPGGVDAGALVSTMRDDDQR